MSDQFVDFSEAFNRGDLGPELEGFRMEQTVFSPSTFENGQSRTPKARVHTEYSSLIAFLLQKHFGIHLGYALF